MNFIRHFLCVLLFIGIRPILAYTQVSEWTWMKGDSTPDSYGNYGTLGIPAPTNEPPNICGAGFWTDTSGNFWIYGGETIDSLADSIEFLGSMWKFDPNAMNWTWMNGSDTAYPLSKFAAGSGVFDSANYPGNLNVNFCTWTDKQNHLWLYGGAIGYPDGMLIISNDLWQYDPAINQWAWMNGSQGLGATPVYGTKGMESPANTPGGRYTVTTAWTDSAGNLWLFGGLGEEELEHNDMWKYDITKGMWAWMSGSKIPGNPGSYGPVGTSSVNYYPSARSTYSYWQDAADNFWLIGGANFPNADYYDDVWKFNPTSLEWTLIKGLSQSNVINTSSGNCQADTINQEGGRIGNALWKVCDQVIINYSGIYQLQDAGATQENDLWAFLPLANEWVEINEAADIGSFGIQGVAAVQNYPPALSYPCSFIDKKNNLWVFGGNHIEIDGTLSFYNDLWKYDLDTACVGSLVCTRNCNLNSPTIVANVDTICPDDSAQICASSGFLSYIWNISDTASCIEVKAAGNYYLTVTDNSGCSAESNHIGITALQAPSISTSESGDTLRVYNATNSQWYINNNAISGATQNIYIASVFGTYTVSVTDTDGCTTFSIPIIYTGISDINDNENIYIYPNPSVGSWQLEVGNNLIDAQVAMLDDDGRILYQTPIKNLHTEIPAPLAGGVYLLRITSGTAIIVRKLVKL